MADDTREPNERIRAFLDNRVSEHDRIHGVGAGDDIEWLRASDIEKVLADRQRVMNVLAWVMDNHLPGWVNSMVLAKVAAPMKNSTKENDER